MGDLQEHAAVDFLTLVLLVVGALVQTYFLVQAAGYSCCC